VNFPAKFPAQGQRFLLSVATPPLEPRPSSFFFPSRRTGQSVAVCLPFSILTLRSDVLRFTLNPLFFPVTSADRSALMTRECAAAESTSLSPLDRFSSAPALSSFSLQDVSQGFNFSCAKSFPCRTPSPPFMKSTVPHVPLQTTTPLMATTLFPACSGTAVLFFPRTWSHSCHNHSRFR